MKTRLLMIIIVIIGIVVLLATSYLDSIKMTIYDGTPEQLQKVLDDCAAQKDGLETNLMTFSYFNDTHSINNITCEWKTQKDILVDEEPVFTGTALFDDTPKQFINKFGESPIIYIVTEDGDDKVYPNGVMIDFEKTNSVVFVNNSPNSVRIQEVGENKIIDIPKAAWRTKVITSGEEIAIQFNSTGHFEFNVKKMTDFLPSYLEHHATGEIVVLSNDTDSLPVEIRAKMAQSMISGYFNKHPALIGVGSGGEPAGLSIHINKKELELREDAESVLGKVTQLFIRNWFLII